MSHADKHGDKIVLVGDRNQIQSVGAGRPFDRLVEAAEASGHLHNLSENYRQRNADLRQAVDLAKDGKMRESLDVLDRTGRVVEILHTDLRRCMVAAQYDKNTLILTGSRESRDSLNGLIRDDLAKRRLIDRSTARVYKVSWADADGMNHSAKREFAKGDVVTFLKNDYRKGFDVRNGERGEVLKTGKDGLSVRLEDGRKVEVDMERYSALDHGYAMTTYKSQGQTYDKVVVEADTRSPQLQDQRNTYVQITRARDNIQVFTDSKADLREASAILNYKTDTFGINATLEKATEMERRVNAEAFGDRAQREAAAKIQQAEALAKRDAEKVADVVRSKRALPSDAPIVVSNDDYMSHAGASKIIRQGTERHLADITKTLRGAETFNGREKQDIARELSTPSSTHALHSAAVSGRPEDAVAFATVRSGVADLPRAIAAFPAADIGKVTDLLKLAAEKDRRLEAAEAARTARYDAAEKSVQAQAAAKRDNENILDAGNSPAKPPENHHVNNPMYVACAEPGEQGAHAERLKEIDDILQGRRDLSDAEISRTADFLNSKDALRLLEGLSSPEQVIAAGLVKARVMDTQEAVKDLPEVQKDTVKIHLKNENIELQREIEREMRQERTRGHGRGLSL